MTENNVVDLKRERVRKQLLRLIESSTVKLIRPLTPEDIERMIDELIAKEKKDE